MSNITSKNKDGKILVNGEYKICNVPMSCNCDVCRESCIINVILRRLYELEHNERND